MLKSQYFWRTYLGYLLILFIATSLLATLIMARVKQNGLAIIAENLASQSELLALSLSRPLANLDFATITNGVRQFSDATGVRFSIIDINGVVLADSHVNPFEMGNLRGRPEIIEAIVNGNAQVLRYSETLQSEFLYRAFAIKNEGRVLGVARAGGAFESIVKNVQAQQNIIFRYALFILFSGLFLALYLAVRQATIVEKITSVAEAISNGDFEKRVSEKGALGLTRLTGVINRLARNTARKVSEVTADRNRLATTFAGLVEGLIDVDQNQNIVHINDAAAKLLEVSDLDCLGKPVWEKIRNHEIVEALDQAIKTQSVIKTQITLQLNNSSTISELTVDIYAASLSDDHGQPVGAVVVLHDVTELKNLERVRTDFVANASHELKTPITAIRGLSETILDDEDAEREVILQFMQRVHSQSIRLTQLVSDLLTLSRLESIQDDKGFTLVNMNGLVTRSIQMSKLAKDEKNLTLTPILAQQQLKVYGDSQNLSQLIDNLINNAIKYTADGGEIIVTLTAEAGQLTFAVKDNGIGINPHLQQRIFERFYRVDKVRSQSLGGTGLGLSIVKNIAEKHSGSVDVVSYPGRGSTFTFRMPLESVETL